MCGVLFYGAKSTQKRSVFNLVEISGSLSPPIPNVDALNGRLSPDSII